MSTKSLLGKLTGYTSKRIGQLNIELCTRCNMRCSYCSLDHEREKQFMDPRLYFELLLELTNNDFKVKRMMLSHSAEVLLHPNFAEILALTKIFKDITPDIEIGLSTNLMLMDKKRADMIIESGVIDFITCSIDGRNKTDLESLRVGVKYETVLENMQYLLSIKDRPRLVVNNGQVLETMFSRTDPNMSKIFREADEYILYWFHDWAGNIESPPGFVSKPKKGLCNHILSNVVVFADGKIGHCCLDLNQNTVYGDLKDNSLHEILTSNRRKKHMLLMALKQRKRVAGCGNCSME